MRRKIFFGLILSIVVLGVGIGSIPSLASTTKTMSGKKEEQAVVKGAEEDIEAGSIVLGDPKAPATIIEFSSLTCAHCAAFHKNVYPELKAKYINTGKARLIFKHFPLDQEGLEAAAILSKIPQIKQEQLLNEIFLNQSRWIGNDRIKKLAEICGITEEKCASYAKDKMALDQIVMSRLNAQKKYHVFATPTFIINGKIVPYAPGLNEFQKLIGS
jgi:protein-disulfide isomerase